MSTDNISTTMIKITSPSVINLNFHKNSLKNTLQSVRKHFIYKSKLTLQMIANSPFGPWKTLPETEEIFL